MQKSILSKYAAPQLCCLQQLTLSLSGGDQEIFSSSLLRFSFLFLFDL